MALDHRTCPMCKLDVIKALGYWVCYVFVYIQSLLPPPHCPPFSLSDLILFLTREAGGVNQMLLLGFFWFLKKKFPLYQSKFLRHSPQISELTEVIE